MLKDEERQPCEIWSRVMGYHRPTTGWNKGKQQEHRDRKMFREEKVRGG
jgi:anaerobic ribonucleoside-triphosphate reductase